jgi:hypothetical protein
MRGELMIETIPDFMTPTEGVDFLARLDRQEQELEGQLETETLVAIFDSHEQAECTLTNGVKAKRGYKTAGSLPKVDEKASAFEQAEQRKARLDAIEIAESYGWGPFIKTTVSAIYDKGDSEKAEKAYMLLRGDNSAVVDKEETIHPMTLGAQVRQRIREGKDVAMDKLGVTVLPAVLLTKKQKG